MIFIHIDSMRRFGRFFFCVRQKLKVAVVAAAFLFAIIVSYGAQAVPINYGTFIGTTVDYVDVSEESNSGDSLPLFGEPTIAGDSLDFNPVGFEATSSGGGADITDSNLVFMIVAHAGHAVTNIMLSEAGDTTIAGFGDNGTLTSVTADGVLNINEVDGVGVVVPSIPISLTFSPSGGLYRLGDLGGGPFFHTQWSGSLLIDIGSILTANSIPFTFGATKVSLDLDNTLTAVSQDGTTALIAKKDFGGISVTVNVPEPASAAFVGLAVVCVAISHRRNRIRTIG